MKKNFVFVVLAVSVLLSISCFASVLHDVVEISFKVGDSTLLINGNEKTVETPYVVGEGVTLVPIRVITEAFGADVGWDGAERKVTLTTEEKNIELWIGKETVIADGKEQTLLSAPEITNNVTMVPLRFISENFGAKVSYDNETKSILVTLDKGPMVQDGMIMFEDENLSLSLPENYDCVTMSEDGRQYRFSKSLTDKKTSDYDTVYSFDFVCPVLDDVQNVLEEDRDNQNSVIDDDYYSVSKVEKRQMYGVDFYSYTVSYKKNTSRFLRIKKTVYNHNDYSYLTISVYDGYENSGKFVKDENDSLLKIDYKEYSVSVPEEFKDAEEPLITPFSIGGKANPEIAISLYKKDKDFDSEKFLKNEADSYRYVVKQITLNSSDVKEYNLGEGLYSGFEVSYKNGGRVYNILLEEEEFVVLLKFEEDCYDKAGNLISSLEYSYPKEKLDKLPVLGKIEYETFETNDFTFELPSVFEVKSNEDEHIFAYDTESSMVFLFHDGITNIANDSYDKKSMISNNPLYPSFYSSLVNKTEISDLVKETQKRYEKDGWKTESTRIKEYLYDDESVPIDSVSCIKSVANNVDIHLENILVFINTDEYTLSEDDKRVKDLMRMVDNSDEEIDMPDQKVCVFTFAYTSVFNEKRVKEIVENLIESFEFN